MSNRAAVTRAQLVRIIKAAREAGLRVTGIESKPDGTVAVATVPLVPDQRADLVPEERAEVVL
jgi:hypothetical protein